MPSLPRGPIKQRPASMPLFFKRLMGRMHQKKNDSSSASADIASSIHLYNLATTMTGKT
jgi:hypothetical protein